MGVKSATAFGLASGLEPGMVLLNTTSVSGTINKSITDIFSSTYDNYKIIFNLTQTGGGTENTLYLRGMTSTEDSSSVYSYYTSSFGVNTTSYTQSSTGTTSIAFGRIGTSGTGSYVMDIMSPNKAENTTISSAGIGVGTTTTFTERCLARIANSTQYTGIFIFLTGNTITGTISVYGYNK